jgi:hypothetical protein
LKVLSSKFRVENIEIFDLLGKKVQSLEIRNPELETVLDITSLPNGVYFVRIKTENDVVIRKVVKE